MEDLNLRICRSAHFDSLESANEAFHIPHLFAELRFDLSSIEIDNIPKLKFPEKLIFTCRTGTLSLSNRLKAYNLAIDMDVDYIDLDFETDMELLLNLKSKIANSKTQLILSQHNYESTPDFKILEQSTYKAFELGADFAKIISTANLMTDLDKIYSLYDRFDDLIAFAMGKVGIESRAKILSLGAPFTYSAFSEKEQTAPGQMNFQQTADLFYKLKDESQ